MDLKELLKKFTLNYYAKEEIGYRLPANIKIDDFWPRLVQSRKIKAETLPFKDQQGQCFWFLLTPRLLELLHLIDSRGKDSLYQMVQSEIRDELVENALIEEAMFSSVIEGAFSTLRRARELIVEGKKPKDTSDQMVMNNGKVMRFILEQQSANCSIELMHTLQKMVTEKTLERETDSGRFRDDLVLVRNSQGELIYTAPSASVVEPAMTALVDWINHSDQDQFIHPILKAAIIHTYFVYIHPYFDGNGRTARSLFYWYLLKNGYDFFKYFSISSIIQETRAQYYRALKNMEDCEADLTYVLLYMTDSVVKAIDVVTQRIIERWHREALFSVIKSKGLFLNERQNKFLRHLTTAQDKTITIARYKNYTKVVFETARRDLLLLEKYKILKRSKQGRKFVYHLNADFLSSFVDSSAPKT